MARPRSTRTSVRRLALLAIASSLPSASALLPHLRGRASASSSMDFSRVSALLERQTVSGGSFAGSLSSTGAGRAGPQGQATVPIMNVANSFYVVNISVGAVDNVVILDTGSSDLWTTTPVPNVANLGKTASVSYAIGKAEGPVLSGPVELAGITVPNQAFLQVSDASSFGNITSMGITGLLGLGPVASSVINATVGSQQGGTVLDGIFNLNTSIPNYVTLLLDRQLNSSVSVTSGGTLTISRTLSGMEAVLQAPRLPVAVLTGSQTTEQHWTTKMDAFLGPDGNKIEYNSDVKGVSNGAWETIFDSGFTLPQVPRKVSDAIYGRVQGAQWDDQDQVWLVPCDQMLNIAVVFGGVTIPVHPLDTVSSDLGATWPDGSPACTGTFQPITSAFDIYGSFDAIMGQSFMRNTYTLLNLGDFDASNSRGDPYVQLLSTTDTNTAHREFVQARMGGVDRTMDPRYALLAAGQGQSSPVPARERVAKGESWLWRNRIAIGIAVAAGGLIILLLALWCCIRVVRRRSVSRQRQQARAAALTSRMEIGGAYGAAGADGVGGPGERADVELGKYRQISDPYQVPITQAEYSEKPSRASRGSRR